MTNSPDAIADKHRELVAKLIALNGYDTDRAESLRWIIEQYEMAFPHLEYTKIEMMAKKLQESGNGTGTKG